MSRGTSKPPRKLRADALVAASEAARDPKHAQALIMAGRVLWSDAAGKERKVTSAGEPLPVDARIRVKGDDRAYVSRSGEKLRAGLDGLGLDVTGSVALDAGISTGGFTQCLLERGAIRVHGVDVAYGRVALPVRDDPRVVLHERTNMRHLTVADLGESVDVLVADLSFVGLTGLLPTFARLLADSALLVLLVKPQFELPRDQVADGIVRDPAARRAAVDRVAVEARALGLHPIGRVASPLAGTKGNREILLGLSRGDASRFRRKDEDRPGWE